MNQERLKEQILIWKNNPKKYIELLEETAGVKFYWYQKLILKNLIKKKTK